MATHSKVYELKNTFKNLDKSTKERPEELLKV